jgi:sn-glycerol 3-phosphate transport system substrate-binding protein
VLANDAGTQVKFDDPKVVEALQYWVDLGKAGVHPPGVVEWGTTPKDFFEKKVAMMYTTTGNLTNVKANAKFDFGVAMIPGNKRKGSPTGGGNFYIFKKATPAQQEAAFKFIKWMTEPRARRAVEHGHRLRRRHARPPTDRRKCASTAATSRPPGGARPAARVGGRVLHA